MYIAKVFFLIKRLAQESLSDVSFIKNFTKLICGTAGAQVITIVTLPFLTHMYAVEDFGLQAIYVSITSMLVIMASGRYELAILLPEKDDDAFSLAILSVLLSLVVCCVVEVAIFLYSDNINCFFDGADIAKWLYFMPFTIIAGLSYNVGCIWLNRMKAYNIMPLTGTIASVCNFCAAYSYGCIYDADGHGLLLNTMVGQLLGAVYIFICCWHRGWLPCNISMNQVKKQAVRYKNFPQFLVFGHMLNIFSTQLPVFLLQSLAGQQVVGYFAMVQKFMVMPSRLIGGAIGNVFMREASEEWRIHHMCWCVYKKTCILLACIGIIVFPIIFIIAPDFLPYFLGEKWKTVGQYIRYLCPAFLILFISSPLSAVYSIAEILKWDMFSQLVRCIMIYGGIMIAFSIDSTGDGVIIGYAFAYCVFYLCDMLVTMILARGYLKRS